MNLDPLRDELNDAALAAGLRSHPPRGIAPWVLFGSTVLFLWGLRDRFADVDVFVSPRLWGVLLSRSERGDAEWTRCEPDRTDPPFLERTIDGVKVHAFFAWTAKDPEVDADQCRRAAELVHGWWCTPLGLIRMHKAMSVAKHPHDPRQVKHHADIAAIDGLLERAA